MLFSVVRTILNPIWLIVFVDVVEWFRVSFCGSLFCEKSMKDSTCDPSVNSINARNVPLVLGEYTVMLPVNEVCWLFNRKSVQ